MTDSAPRRALVSVSDKTGLTDFARGLVDIGFEIISTGGTRRHLEEAGLPIIDISEYTGFPEIMGGRVKTLHPKVHGAILGRPDLPSDAEAIAAHDIVPFTVVVCNLYPFAETIAKPGVTLPEAIEQIDIGGPSMVRSAAKNQKYLGIVTRPEQYETVLTELRAGSLTEATRASLAAAAFEMTATYDRMIADYLSRQVQPETESATFPASLDLHFEKRAELRSGENPHQQACFYVDPSRTPGTLADAEQLNGKDLSFNNLVDLDAALNLIREFKEPAAAVLKHTNPCGCAVANSLADAYERAHQGDPVSAFGSIIGLNRSVDAATAEQMAEPGRFIEAIIAPDFDDDAFEILTTKPKWKSNVRLMRCPNFDARPDEPDFRRVTGGVLLQERDYGSPIFAGNERPSDWKVVTERQPTDAEWRDLIFVWTVAKHVKSNAIVFAKDGMVTGTGAGQMSRLDSAFVATHKSNGRCAGGVVGSDAFFPFRDGIDQAHEAGICAAIQPGGSRQDESVTAAANEHGMAMVMTGMRHFKH